MVAIALVDARPQVASRRARTHRSRGAVAMIVVGALATAGAVTAALTLAGGPSTPHAVAEVAERDAGITTSERHVSVVTQVYDPGQSSGWHLHAGVHAVAILSGTLTVYDDQCRPAQFGPGQPYVGGRQVHLARNDSDVPVEMVVTYIDLTRPQPSTTPAPPPPACSGPVPPVVSSNDER
jgi:quercetin dioxygenase-like cupin family protein